MKLRSRPVVKVSRVKLIEVLREANGKVFSVTFTKRSTGEERTMICRTGVTKGVTGEGMKYDPADHALMPVYDFQKKAYRMVSLDSMTRVIFRGKQYEVK